jgi:peptide/nickel transport system substrate-binding protein
VDWIKDDQVVGPYEVRIIAKEPTPAALTYLADQTPIYPDGHYDSAPALSNAKGDARKDFGAVLPMCTGPYILKDFHSGSSFTLVKNPNYFKDSPKGQPHIGKLVFKTIPDTDSQMAAIMTHQVDWLWSVLPQNAKQLGAVPGITVTAAPTTRMSFLSLDASGRSGPNPLEKLQVRQAIAHAIDKNAIAKDLVGPGSKPLKSMCYPEQFGCTEDVRQYDYDPALAKKLLAEAGYPNGIKNLDFLVREAATFKLWAVAIQAMLKETLNIETKLRTVQISAWFEEAQAGNFDIAISAIVSTLMDPSDYFNAWYFTNGPQNYSKWSNKEFDALAQQIDRETDDARRKALVRQAELILEQDPPLLPVSWEKIYDGWYTYVKGVNPYHIFGIYDVVRWDTAWLDK